MSPDFPQITKCLPQTTSYSSMAVDRCLIFWFSFLKFGKDFASESDRKYVLYKDIVTNVFSDISVTLSLTPCVRGRFTLFDSSVSPSVLTPLFLVTTYTYFALKQEANLIKFSGVLMANCGGRVRRTHSASELWKSHGHLDDGSV